MRKILAVYCLLALSLPLASDGQTAKKTPANHPISPGKFIRSWLIAGPLRVSADTTIPDISTQQSFFNNESPLPAAFTAGSPLQVKDGDGKDLKWINYTSPADEVNFDSLFKNTDYAAAYAYTEVRSDRDMPALLAVGSDDGIKVFLNGKLVHKNWIPRAINADDDIVPLQLAKGNNALLIQVQDMAGGWGFIARFLDKSAAAERLVKAASAGNIPEVKMLTQHGADPYRPGKSGISAIQAARINGRKQTESILAKNAAKDVSVPAAGNLIDALYADVNKKDGPGIVVLVAKDGNIVYSKGFGFSDIKNKIRVIAETKFRIGSITKQFTASAILKLQEEGKLNVKDKMSKYFPDFPRGDEVTIHHLLTHTSGIHSYTNTDSFFNMVSRPIAEDKLYGMIKEYPYDFNPGERYQYNNSGYFLLGYLVEKLSGKTLDEYFKEKFFIPLEMNNTGIYRRGLNLQHEALGYSKSGVKYDSALNWDMRWAAGAGALYSTVEDLNKWNNALYNGKVLSAESYKAATTPVLLNSGNKPPGTDYGYGLGMSNFRGLESIGHSGGVNGFISQLTWYPREKMTVVMLTNQSPPEVELNPNKIAEFFVWQKLDSQPSYDVTDIKVADLKVYEGRFDISNGMVMTITSDSPRLYAQVSGQPKFEIFPSKPDEFFWKVVEAKVHFNRNEKGEVVSANMEQGSFKVTAPKMKEETIVTVDPAAFKDYTGKYNYSPSTIIDITVTDGKLYAQATGEQRYEMLPLSKEEYLIRELNAHLIFMKDAEGKVDRLNISLGGMKKDAKKIK